jgi:hypothetical protein
MGHEVGVAIEIIVDVEVGVEVVVGGMGVFDGAGIVDVTVGGMTVLVLVKLGVAVEEGRAVIVGTIVGVTFGSIIPLTT